MSEYESIRKLLFGEPPELDDTGREQQKRIINGLSLRKDQVKDWAYIVHRPTYEEPIVLARYRRGFDVVEKVAVGIHASVHTQQEVRHDTNGVRNDMIQHSIFYMEKHEERVVYSLTIDECIAEVEDTRQRLLTAKAYCLPVST